MKICGDVLARIMECVYEDGKLGCLFSVFYLTERMGGWVYFIVLVFL